MPFARSGAATQTAPTPPTPPSLGVPQPPAGAVVPPPAPPAPTEPKYYVAIGGQSVLMPKSEAQAQNPNLPCMTEDQKSGWQTVAVLLPMANPMRPGASAVGGFAGRAGQPQQQSYQSGAAPANLYAGVENAEVVRRGAFMEPGEYVAKLLSAEYKQGRQKNQVIIEIEIIISSYTADKPDTHAALREGQRAVIFIAKNDSFLNNIKEIVIACSGFDEAGKWRTEDDVVTAAECEALTSADQDYAGALVYLEARQIMTKADKPFTHIQWWPCPVHPANTPDAGKPDMTKLFSQVRI